MQTPFIPEFKKYGPLLLYKGFSKSLIKASFGSIFFYPLYDIFNGHIKNSPVAAMMSAIISTILLQPIDYMKVRQLYGQLFFFGWNLNSYFKGFSLNLGRIVPHFTITITCIEYFNKIL